MPDDLRDLAAKLCAALFSGGEIEHARAHAITTPFTVEPHAHADLLQFDWVVNCRGGVTIDGAKTPLAGGCAFVLVAPKRVHAMHLEAAADGARVYHTRLRLPGIVGRAFHRASRVAAALPVNPSLEAALNDVWRLTVGGAERSLLRKARLAEAIALWPGGSDAVAGSAKPAATSGLDRDLDAALKLMEQSLPQPPTLDDLADAAHLSVRQFTRRFRDAFGIPPIEFLDRKRLVLAQQMLAYEASTVSEVSGRMAFSSPAVFSRWFSNLAGESPSEYRARPHAL